MEHNRDLRSSLVSSGHIELEQEGHNLNLSRRDSDISSIGDTTALSAVDKLDDQEARAQENSTMITLEVMSGRVMFLLIALSYLTFIGSYIADYVTIRTNGRAYHTLGNQDCMTGSIFTSMPLYSNDTNNYGCIGQPDVWYGQVLDLENVISVSLNLQYTNENSSYSNFGAPSGLVEYDCELWACYEDSGCGTAFDESETDSASNEWEKVLVLPTESGQHNMGSFYDMASDKIGIPLINITFQNQESIPTNGIVKSYYMKITYYPQNNSTSHYLSNPESEYKFTVIKRPPDSYENLGVSILCFFTVLFTAAFSALVYKHQGWRWLPEQVWLVIYFVGIILFQNPIYLALNWNRRPSADVAYASYFIDRMSQVLFLVMWLLFADSIHCRDASSKHWKPPTNGNSRTDSNAGAGAGASASAKTRIGTRLKEFWRFYGPKVFFGCLFFSVSITLLTYQFPSVTKDVDHRSPVLAVVNWPEQIQRDYIVLSVFYFCLFTFWILWWIRRMYTSGRTLNEVPYMQTRYLQLSFRFFSSQTILVFIYFVVQYATAVSLFFNAGESADETIFSQNRTTLTNEVNTIFRQNAQLFGKAMFLTIYQGILAFLFLPSAVIQTKGSAALAATTFVIKERSLGPVTRSRRRAIRKMKSTAVVGRFNNILVQAKAEVFCVEVALQSLHVAFEAYYDVEGTPTLSGSGPHNVEVGGFRYVGCIYNAEVETFCLVAYHKDTRKLVVSFRGSRVSRHWKSNLDYGKIDFDIKNWCLPSEVDAEDGLDVSGGGGGGDGGGDGDVMSPFTRAGAAEDSGGEDNNKERNSGNSVHSFHSAQGNRDSDEDSFYSANDEHDGWYDTAEDSDEDEDNDRGSGARGAEKRDSTASPSRQRQDSGSSTGREGPLERSNTLRETFIEPVIINPVNKATKATAAAVGAVTDTVGGLAISAARITPGLNTLVKEQVHKGFWEAYDKVRVELHALVRRQLKEESAAKIVFAGHSLGGALATLASCDIAVHTLPRINEHYKNRARCGHGNDRERDRIRLGTTCRLALYNFGSPKVGNGAFARWYDSLIPDAFRVIVDGDIVPTMPLTGYSHIGTRIVIDGKGFGSIIIDPSIVERWLRPSNTGISTHFMEKYRAGLEGILVVHNAISTASSAFTKAAERRPSALTTATEQIDYRSALANRLGEQKALEDGERLRDGGEGDEGEADGRERSATELEHRRVAAAEGKKKLGFQMPLVSYAITQAYNLIYARFDRSVQQRFMEETLNAESVPFRENGVRPSSSTIL